ncbi:MAG: signal recognition particle protein [Firmicutes bacterium]|nr:signal recognition particle protein [Bacillota bacterium]
MLFGTLADKLQEVFRKLKGKGKLSEKDIDLALREIRLALLEADVNYKVVRDFVNTIRERALGAEVLKSLTPGQQVVKIVHEDLIELMGRKQSKLAPADHPPQAVMLVGLQGSGKTTTAAKLALFLKKGGHNPLLVAADVYRPAAIEQLEVLGKEAGIAVFSRGKDDPVNIGRLALKEAAREGNDYVILDTAGRLHIDAELMAELGNLKARLDPREILLVVDAMTGQDAVNAAGTFHEKLGLTGVILTKLDGDTRGGAALSVKAVTDRPIKFVGVGEKIEAFEPFHPDRMASRILGMGDVLSLIEKAQQVVDVEKSRTLEKKIREQALTLEDFLEQLQQIKQMGPLEDLLGMVPGFHQVGKQLKGLDLGEKQILKIEAVLSSMTLEERQRPGIINSSRKRRISAGSGTTVQDVNRLLKQFDQMKKLLKQANFMDKGRTRKPRGFFPFR